MNTLRPKPIHGHSDTFIAQLETAVMTHPALSHPFIKRFATEQLSLDQLRAFAGQHYLYSRRFANNLAAIIANAPDERVRTVLVHNMYEEIGEPSRLRDRAHVLLLESGLVSGPELGAALEAAALDGGGQDVVAALIDSGLVTRAQVTSVVAQSRRTTRELTRPALYRRFLAALGLHERELENVVPIRETAEINDMYCELCREGHWLEGISAIGPGTQTVLPSIYGHVLDGIRRSELLQPTDSLFWTLHVHCDASHSQLLVDTLRPYARSLVHQQRILTGALRALDARCCWFDGLLFHVFGETPAVRRPSNAPLRSFDPEFDTAVYRGPGIA